MSEITDKLETIIINHGGYRLNKTIVLNIAKAMEAAMIPGYASCEQCGDGDCPETENACHIKGFRINKT